jgi:hypothetical protein
VFGAGVTADQGVAINRQIVNGKPYLLLSAAMLPSRWNSERFCFLPAHARKNGDPGCCDTLVLDHHLGCPTATNRIIGRESFFGPLSNRTGPSDPESRNHGLPKRSPRKSA